VEMRFYRPAVVVSALSSFLTGMHTPALHQIVHHGRNPGWDVLAVIALLAALAVAAVWWLLRAPSRSLRP
jgi:hypothetical protein